MMNERGETIVTWRSAELAFTARTSSGHPYAELWMRVEFESPTGARYVVPGFWDGERRWLARFAPNAAGAWTWKTVSNDRGLDGRQGAFFAETYEGELPAYRHGFLRTKGRGFVHADGTPFFWLGDTVWSASAHATREEWLRYVAARGRQGFNVAQINSLPQWDASTAEHRKPFAESDGGFDYGRPNPEYFRFLDGLVCGASDAGLIVAMVVLWFNYVPETNVGWGRQWGKPMSPGEARKFAAYLAARYAAYGVVWLISGDTDYESETARRTYREAARAVREASPYCALLTAHLNGGLATPETMHEEGWLDFHMFQSCHFSDSVERALSYAAKDRAYEPARPVLNGEPCYDRLRIMDPGNEEGRRFDRELVRETAWASLLGGANAGLTYGAHGLWPWHRDGQPYPEAMYGHPPTWEEALTLDSGDDMVRMKRLLESLPWMELEPVREGVRAGSDGVRVVASVAPGRFIAYARRSTALELDPSRSFSAAAPVARASWHRPDGGSSEPARWRRRPDGGLTIEPPGWPGDAVLVLELGDQ